MNLSKIVWVVFFSLSLSLEKNEGKGFEKRRRKGCGDRKRKEVERMRIPRHHIHVSYILLDGHCCCGELAICFFKVKSWTYTWWLIRMHKHSSVSPPWISPSCSLRYVSITFFNYKLNMILFFLNYPSLFIH
jgi:hypothetical protein